MEEIVYYSHENFRKFSSEKASSFFLTFFVILFLSITAFSMDFTWGPSPWNKLDKSDGCLYLSGEIKSGDYERFRTFMIENLEKFKKSARIVSLSSNGGNLVESLRIAELLKSMYVTTDVVNGKCASSCFFLYLSGIERFALHGSIGIHRAYFDDDYAKGLSPSDAHKRFSELTEAVKKILNENGVPQYLLEKMNATSSAEAYWLTSKDIKNLGAQQPWFEQMLIAKCSKDVRIEKEFEADPSDEAMKGAFGAYYRKQLKCQNDAIAPELEKLGSLLQPVKSPTTLRRK